MKLKELYEAEGKRMTIASINKAIAKAGYPQVELVKGNGYHYFIFDSKNPDVYETESVMTAHTYSQSGEEWVQDAIEFAKKVIRDQGLES